MNFINTENFVSLEVAKMLKEKECNIKFDFRYIEAVTIEECKSNKHWTHYEYYWCPTLYEAQKWLRSTKMINVEVSYMSGDYWIYEILTIPKHDLVGLSDRQNVKYKTYEEALNAGILEALKMI